MGGPIDDIGKALAVRNGKALMVGTSGSPLISPSNTKDVIIVEIDKDGDNQCELFLKNDITDVPDDEFEFNSTSFVPMNFTTALITADVRTLPGQYSPITKPTEPVCSGYSPIPPDEGVPDKIVYAYNYVDMVLPEFCEVLIDVKLNYFLYRGDGSPVPSWVLFNPLTRTINGLPLIEDTGLIEYLYRAVDPDGLNDEIKFKIRVAPLPIVNLPPNLQKSRIGTLFSFTIPEDTISDPEEGKITYTLSNLPSWLTYSPLTQTISGTSTVNQIGITSVNIIGTSVYNATTQTTLSIQVT
jgi:hypothetical protein